MTAEIQELISMYLQPNSDIRATEMNEICTKIATEIDSKLVGVQNINGVTPSSAIPATGNFYTIVTTPGTYVNWNSIVIPVNTFAVLSRIDGVYGVSQTPLDISSKVNVSDIKNDLVSADVNKPLSANQGKVLKDLIDNKPNTPVIDNVSTASTTSALSAAQGKVLNEKFNNYATNSALSVVDDKFNNYATDVEVAIIETNLNNAISSVASGSPKGSYANLTDLQAAFPSGNTNIYVTSNDGHWHYYNAGWQDGGVYQSELTATIKSNESLTSAQRKGDVLHGILDQYTGEEITLSKVTGTPTVDGIIYFQIGSEYFKRVFTKINSEWFGLDKTGLTDSALKIQAILNESMLSNVDVDFADGTYLLNSSVSIYVDGLLSRLALRGSGKTIFKNGFSGDMLVIGQAEYENAQSGYGTIDVIGINFDNNGKTNATAIRVRSQKHIDLNNLYIYGGWSVGISLKAVYSTPKIHNVRIHGCTHGIVSHGQVNNIIYDRVALLACEIGFYAHPDSGTGLISGELDTNTFTNCDFEGNTNSILIDSPHGCTSLRILNNHFEGNAGAEITINNYTSTNIAAALQTIVIENNMLYNAHEIKIGNSLLGGNVYNVSFNGNKVNTFIPNAVKICTESASISYNYTAYNNYYENDGTVQVEKQISQSLLLEKSKKGVAGNMPIYPFEPVLPYGQGDIKGMTGEIRWDDTNLYFKTRTKGWKYIPMGQADPYPVFNNLVNAIKADIDNNVGINTEPFAINGVGGLVSVYGSNTTGVRFKTASKERRVFFSDNVIYVTDSDGLQLFRVEESGRIKTRGYNLFELDDAPANASSAGGLGEIKYTADYMYVCTATNTWKRTALTTW